MNLISPDIPGLVWAYRFVPGESRCRRIAADLPVESLEAGEDWVWLHLALSDARTPALIERIGNLPQEAIATLTSHDTQAAITVADDVVHGTLVDFERTFDAVTQTIGWLHFAVSDRMIITTRLHPLRSVDRVKAAVEKSARCRRPIDLFEMLVVEFQRTLITLVLELTEELNVIEDHVYGRPGTASSRAWRHCAGPSCGCTGTCGRCSPCCAGPEPWKRTRCRRALSTWPRLSDRLEAVDRDVFALQERARLLHEEIDSKISSETNRHLYILSLMTAFLLPPTLVTGFFGMNTGALPFPRGSGTNFAGMLIASSMGLAWIVLKRIGII